MTPPVTELEQLKQQNALLLKRLLNVSRERDALAAKVAASGGASQCAYGAAGTK